MQKPKPPSSPEKLEANFPISNKNVSNSKKNMDIECGEQASAPAQLLEALQAVPFCWLTAPNCTAGEAEDITGFLYFKKRKCSMHWRPFTNI